MKTWLKRIGIQAGITALVLMLFLTVGAPALNSLSIGQHVQKALYTIGFEGVAYAVTPDYEVDGADDDVQVQAALNALPVTGGRLVLFAGNYVFSATVSRAINNVTIEGDGKGTYLAHDGVTALFTAGAQTGWAFKDFRTDAGYLTLATDTRVQNVWNVTVMVGGSPGATVTVAASNANANEKAAANWIADGTNDNVEIQAAVDALTSTGGTVQLSSGNFSVSAAIVIDQNNTYIQGSGPGVTVVSTSSGTANVFTFGNGTNQYENLGISDLTVRASVARTAGAGIQVAGNLGTTNIFYFRLSNVEIYDQYDGLRLDQANIAWVNRLSVWTTVHSAVSVNGTASDQYLSNVLVSSWGAEATGAGIDLLGTTAIWLTDIDVLEAAYGVWIHPASGDTVAWVFGTNCAFDTNDVGAQIQPAVGGTVKGVYFDNSWFSSNDNQGFFVTGSGTIDGVRIDTSRIVDNGAQGFINNSTTSNNTYISNSTFSYNSIDTPGAADGIVFNGVSHFTVEGNRSGQAEDWVGNTQQYGIHILGASDYYVITGNDVVTNVTGGINNAAAGAHSRVSNNIGYVTENSGTGTITTTSLVVTHGLSITPTLAKIKIVGLEDPTTSVGTIWVSNATSTQFTVHVETDPGASDWDFGWSYQD